MTVPTTFNNAVRIGDKLNSGKGHVKALGFAAVSQSALIGFADDGVAKDICTIPANSQIIEIYVDVYTAFDDTGTDLLTIGKDGAADHFADALDLSSAARLLGSSDVSQLTNYQDVGATQVTIQGTFTGSNSNAAAGSARVTVVYIPANDLVE